MGKKVLVASSVAAMGGWLSFGASAYGAFTDPALGNYDAGPQLVNTLGAGGASTEPLETVADANADVSHYSATGAGTYVNLNTFTNQLAKAFATGVGGDETFEGLGSSGTTNFASGSEIDMTYASGAKTIPMVISTFTDAGGGGLTIGIANNNTSSTEPSSNFDTGRGYNLFPVTQGDKSGHGYNHINTAFGSITGGLSGEAVLEAGVTVMGRASGQWATQLVTLTYTFSDNSTETLTSQVTNTKGANVFFGLAAPAGLSITNMLFTPANDTNTAGNGTTALDDIAVITEPVSVPEPASLGMVGLIAGASFLRRRRR